MKHSRGHIPFLILACAVTVFVAGVYVYMFHHIGILIATSEAARQAVASGKMDREHAQEFMQSYQSSAASLGSIPHFFVPSDDAVVFIEAIESLGNQTGATASISSIQADNLDGQAPGTTGSVNAHVTAVGSWSQVMRTLELAELLPYEVVVSNTNMNVSTAGTADTKAKTGVSPAVRSWNLSFDIKASIIVPFASSTPASASAASTSTATPPTVY